MCRSDALESNSRDKHEMENTVQVRAEALFVYPIKSCAGIRVPRLHFTPTGSIEGNREWVIVDAGGEVTWQGSHPRLALVRPAIDDTTLVLGASGVTPLKVSRLHADNHRDFRIWNDATKAMDSYLGFDAGEDAAAFLRHVTGADLRLVRPDANAVARDSANHVHLISTTSLQELNQFLATRDVPPMDMIRLRPNIVLTGDNMPPFLEEQFSLLRWTSDGQVNQLSVYERCVRCIVPNVNPETAEVIDEYANAVAQLSAQRYPGEPSYFGIYARTSGCARLAEGEIMEVDLNF
jgi:uncharacterized protein YcbX